MNEKELIRRALLGDKQAQEECTAKGIALPCPFCRSNYTQVRHMGWNDPPQAFQAGYRGECTVCHAVTGARKTEQEALSDWNTRPAPPIGRCKDYKEYHSEGPGVGYCNLDDYGRDDTDFCSEFEPKEE